jgi:hypothetical protein
MTSCAAPLAVIIKQDWRRVQSGKQGARVEVTLHGANLIALYTDKVGTEQRHAPPMGQGGCRSPQPLSATASVEGRRSARLKQSEDVQ